MRMAERAGQVPQVGELLDAATAAVRELVAGCPPGDPIQDRIRKVARAVDRLAALTDSLDATVRRRAGRASPLELNGAVRQMAVSLQRLLGPFTTLETSYQGGGLWAAAARTELEQVLLGLVINAREAMPLGGTVRVSTRRWQLDAPARFRIGCVPAGTWAVLEVHDNGAGVDEPGARHLLDRAEPDGSFGSSLSLATVSSVVTEAGGQIVLDLPAGGGTTLAACFPAIQSPRQRQPATGTASAVLIVDDDEWSRMSAARTLRQAGFGVLEAGHADDAVELLDDVAGSCVRVMLVDAAHLIAGDRPLGERVRHERPEIDVVVTASHRASTGSAADRSVLIKPYAAEELLQRVRERVHHPS